ncbi:MAG TPA: hypothetical protein VEH06_09490 [Candidatus Bathyarchaeia archaeon]|nr:hypothetical protein [Candidatus Bathyarchaeia archaeon]
MEQSQIWSTSYTIKCRWWAGRKILKLVKKYNTLFAFRTAFDEVVFAIREDDARKEEIYKLLLQNGAKEINMKSGML